MSDAATALTATRPVAVGVDTGGTHTDVVLFHEGRLVTLKVPSTPSDLSEGIVGGVGAALAQGGVAAGDVDRFVYATTYVTNLIVEEAGFRVGLITTAGFRDVLEIGRASRKPHIYDIHWRPAPPLVPRERRFGVRERVAHDGTVLAPLDEDDARRVLAALAAQDVQGIAVCLFHAYANPVHERRLAALAEEVCPGVDVSLSSEVVREFREYERTSTTVVNAAIRGPIRSHLGGLERALRDRGVASSLFVMRGNGGVSTFAKGTETPVAVTHSGPMGGIVGGTTLAAACGLRNIITIDMGGTSADVSLVSDGTPLLTNRSHIGPYPLLVPMLDLITIGAGGGSIGWLDRGEALRVGPRSAGSVPGPACYGQGGTAPTVTDCNLLCGRLNPGYFLAGARALDGGLARDALAREIAGPLDMTLDEAALGVIAVAEAHMINALRLVSVDRGIDPRDFTLVAFGGAGPLHAVALAEALSIDHVLVPPAPGNLSATGLVLADVRHDFVRTAVSDLAGADAELLRETVGELTAEAVAALDDEGVPAERRRLLLSVDLRYQGQNYELNLPLDGDALDRPDPAAVAGRFHANHRTTYGYALEHRPVQIVNLRLTAVGTMPEIVWPRHDPASAPPRPHERRAVLLADGTRGDVPVFRFDSLAPEHRLEGPAIVEYQGSTLLLPPGWRVELDSMKNAHARRIRPARKEG